MVDTCTCNCICTFVCTTLAGYAYMYMHINMHVHVHVCVVQCIVTREIQCTMYMHALTTVQIKRMCPTFIMCSRKRVRWSFLLTNTLIYMPGLEYWGTGSVCVSVCVYVCVWRSEKRKLEKCKHQNFSWSKASTYMT